MAWIQHPVTLVGRLVRLEPLAEHHFNELMAIGKDSGIWTNLPIDGTDPAKLQTELRSALLHRTNGTQYPFAIINHPTGAVIGSTRFLEIFREHKKVEIGWTWYDPAVWGAGYNLECKLLLLTYCFEILELNRVQLKTRDTNKRSQAAIRKIGGIYEGILRRDRVMPNGNVRDTVVFSLIKEEWPEAKAALTEKLAPFLPV